MSLPERAGLQRSFGASGQFPSTGSCALPRQVRDLAERRAWTKSGRGTGFRCSSAEAEEVEFPEGFGRFRCKGRQARRQRAAASDCEGHGAEWQGALSGSGGWRPRLLGGRRYDRVLIPSIIAGCDGGFPHGCRGIREGSATAGSGECQA